MQYGGFFTRGGVPEKAGIMWSRNHIPLPTPLVDLFGSMLTEEDLDMSTDHAFQVESFNGG